MGGLLERAKRYRAEGGFIIMEETGPSETKRSTLNKEEEQEILEEIEEIVEKERLRVDETTFRITARKRGVLLPLLINCVALLAIAGAFIGFRYLTTQEQEKIASGRGTINAVEARLIQEIQREAQEKLRAKEQEIASIQKRLQELQAQQEQLQSEMEERIREKESQLREQLSLELERERERLQEAGVPQEQIETRLAEFEAQKQQEFDQELARFREEAEAERQRLLETITRLQQEYEGTLTRLTQEREALQTEFQQHEAELRRQYEARTEALQAQTREAQTALEEARAELGRLSRMEEEARAVENQILGLYRDIRSAIQDEEYTRARRFLTTLQDLLNQPRVAALSPLSGRRQIDIFITETLSRLIEQEQQTRLDTATLLAQSRLLSRIENLVDQARTALSSGDTARAEELYTAALSTLPAVKESHDYLLQMVREEETRRREALTTALSRAEDAYRRGSHQEALAAYREALAYLPLPASRREALVSSLLDIGGRTALSRVEREGEDAASTLLAQARSREAEGDYPSAMEFYARILSRLSQTPVGRQAFEGLTRSMRAYNRQVEQENTAHEREAARFTEQISSLEEQLEALRSENARLKEERDRMARETRTLPPEEEARIRREIERLTQENDALTMRIQELTRQLTAAQEELEARPPATTDEELESLKARIETLEKAEARLSSLSQGYETYARTEDQLLSRYGERGRVEAKSYLDTFLGSSEVEATFPGLLARIKEYDRAFEKAGREAALLEVIDLVEALSVLPSREARVRFLEEQARETEEGSLLEEIIEALTLILE
ncbi:hypothetical protein Spith_0099 [Spirochaeta thermophila DSM 6578]|uniref:Tetratricopeptide repeat protein n=1 Tax=Winmispira thermophila (strain ATCC 700085 / DSM 6578 / Z-1203) TaxID=869211 RepID=G0GC22_WINT7|nr:hypothetical protein [Spirochaeta thermophila]AEJ60386.1 hypothetical protein Spith_0099 [Spirochaeta thermophila DSM 6578]